MSRRPYLRFPHVRGELTVFTADDDVWLVGTTGGRAARLTSDRVPVARPKLSPDGATVAWLSRRDGAPEVNVMPVDGGEPRRLTYWGTRSTRLLGWTDDGRVVASSPTGQPFTTYTWAYALPVDGRPGERLPYGPTGGLAVHPDGAVALQSVIFREAADWKRYRGGTAAKLWLDADGSGTFEPFLRELDGQLTDPQWIGRRLVFVSDHEGHGNVYSVELGGGDLRRHSDHTGMYARNLAGDGQRAAYQHEGDIWLITDLAPAALPARLAVTLPGARTGRAPVTHLAEHAIGCLSVDHTGRASAVEVRGTIQWLTHLDGPVRALSDTPGVRARLPVVAGQDGTVVWVTDADGDDALEMTVVAVGGMSSAEFGRGTRRILAGQLGRVLELAVSPDGRWAGVASHDGRVLAVDLAAGSAREVEGNPRGDASGLAFSPDSRWLAWSAPHAWPLRSIRLAPIAGGDPIEVTPVRFTDTEPVFTGDGKYLAFLSARTFDPVYDAHNFELSFPVGVRPYLLPLGADSVSPFDPELAGRALTGSEPPEGGSDESAEPSTPVPGVPAVGGSDRDLHPDTDIDADAGPRTPTDPHAHTHADTDTDTDSDADDGAPIGDPAGGGAPTSGRPRGSGSEAIPTVTVDPAGLPARVVAVPVAAGLYRQLRAVKGGLAWLDRPLTGEIGADRPAGSKRPRAVLRRWDFGKRTDADIVEDVDGYDVSGDGTRIVVWDGDELRVGPADHKVDDPAPGEVVTVDLERARVISEPGAEWRQMTTETWRLMRDHFWVEDMAGVDWEDVARRYLPVVDRLATRDELSEVLWEMIAELGTSHAYERAAGPRTPPGRAAAFLGADLVRDDDRTWRVVRVLPGESSVPSARSPLEAAGVGVGPSDALVAINGRPVGDAGPGPLLAGLADKPVELTVARDGRRRSVVVVPVPDETPLRYQAWVSDRRAHVHARTGGRVGYVHVPDMVSTGWAEFNRDLRGEMACDAVVVDTRENGGGHTSELVIERLARRIVGWQSGRYSGTAPYPSDAPRGPLVSIANEMAGSDGDIVNQAFKSLRLGPVVGTRTWGGVIGIDGRYDLVDGTGVTQPRYSFWFSDVGWGVENHGVDPDVEVPMPPQAWTAGDDPQLDAGVDIVLDALDRYDAVRMAELSTRPTRAAPDLPPRPGSRTDG